MSDAVDAKSTLNLNKAELLADPPLLCEDSETFSGDDSSDGPHCEIADNSAKKNMVSENLNSPKDIKTSPAHRSSVAEKIEKSRDATAALSGQKSEVEDIFLKMATDLALPVATRRKEQQEEFQKLLREGSTFLSQGQTKIAADKYLDALAMLSNKIPQELNVEPFHIAVVKYALSKALVDSQLYENIIKAIELLSEIECDHFIRFPAVCYGIGQAYLKLNRHAKVEEYSKKGLDFLQKQFIMDTLSWPGTEIVIEETDPLKLEGALTKLFQLSRSAYSPDAICRYSKCLSVSTHIIPSCNIYINDPDFHGFVETLCSARCRLQYHVQCWKVYKKDSAEVKTSDKDFLGQPCPTPDCKSSIIVKIEIFNEKGDSKSNYVFDQDKIKHSKHKNKIVKKIENVKKTKPEARRKKREPEKMKDENPEKSNKITKRQHSNEWNDDNTASCVDSRTAFLNHNEDLNCVRELRSQEGATVEVQQPELEELLDPLHPYNSSNDIRQYVDILELKNYLQAQIGDDVETKLKNATDFIYSYFYEYLKHTGPITLTALNEKWNKDKYDILREDIVQSAVPVAQGILEFLLRSIKFACIEDYVCIASDIEKADALIWPALIGDQFQLLNGKSTSRNAHCVKSSLELPCKQTPFVRNEVASFGTRIHVKDDSSSSSSLDEYENDEFESEDGSESDGSSDSEDSPDQEVELVASSREPENRVASIEENLANNDKFNSRNAKSVSESNINANILSQTTNINRESHSGVGTIGDRFQHRQQDCHVFEAFSDGVGQGYDWPSEVVTSVANSVLSSTHNLTSTSGINLTCDTPMNEDHKSGSTTAPHDSPENSFDSHEKYHLPNDTSSALVKKYEETVTANSQLKVENFSLRDRLLKAENRHKLEVAKLKQENTELTMQITTLHDNVNTIEKQMKNAVSERDYVVDEMAKMGADHDAFRKSCTKTMEILKHTQEQLEDKTRLIWKMQKEATDQKVIFDLLKEQIHNREEQILNMKGEHAESRFCQLIETCANNIGKMSTAVYFLSENTIPKRSEMEKGIRDWNEALVNMQGMRDNYLQRVNAQLVALEENKPLDGLQDVPFDLPPLPPYPLDQLIDQLLRERRAVAPSVRNTSPAHQPTPKPTHQLEIEGPDLRNITPVNETFGQLRGGSAAGGMEQQHSSLFAAAVSDNVDLSKYCRPMQVLCQPAPPPPPPPTTKFKNKFDKLMYELQIKFPNKTKAELSECVGMVRLKHNNKLSGLSFEKIVSDVETIIKERSTSRTETMGLHLFKQTGAWGQQKPVINVAWSGKDKDEVECVICCDEQVKDSMTKLPCNHEFHTECIRRWLRSQSSCPSCRVHATMPDEYPPLA